MLIFNNKVTNFNIKYYLIESKYYYKNDSKKNIYIKGILKKEYNEE